ncbi:LORF2 protein, partial [Crocuta crocuta]
KIQTMHPQLYGQLLFNKAGKSIQWKIDSLSFFFFFFFFFFLQIVYCLFNQWENWSATCRRMKLDQFITPYTQKNSKWMQDLNVRQETVKILEENTASNLFNLGHSNFLL